MSTPTFSPVNTPMQNPLNDANQNALHSQHPKRERKTRSWEQNSDGCALVVPIVNVAGSRSGAGCIMTILASSEGGLHTAARGNFYQRKQKKDHHAE